MTIEVKTAQLEQQFKERQILNLKNMNLQGIEWSVTTVIKISIPKNRVSLLIINHERYCVVLES